MAIAQTTAIERVARALAARHIKRGGEVENAPPSIAIDRSWREYVGDATEVIRALREPDPAMANAGDPSVWTAMVRAALGEEVQRPHFSDGGEIYQKPLG